MLGRVAELPSPHTLECKYPRPQATGPTNISIILIIDILYNRFTPASKLPANYAILNIQTI